LNPIWSYAGLRRSLILPLRWFEYRRVANDWVSGITPPLDRETLHLLWGGDLMNQITVNLGNDATLIDGSYIKFSEIQNTYATALLEDSHVCDAWWRGGPDTELKRKSSAPDVTADIGSDAAKRDKKPSSSSRADVPAPCDTDDDACKVAIANEYIAMRFGAYVRYITLQLKNLMTFMSMGFLFLLLASVSYPFAEPQTIAWSAIGSVIALLVGVGTVLMQMDRDSILSRMSETDPGKVDKTAFLQHMLSVGGLPVLTALSALFPSIGSLLFSWLQPLLATLH